MIGFFKGRKQEEPIDIRNRFNWIDELENQKLDLSGQDFEARLTEIKSVHPFLKSEDGKRLVQSLYDDMIGIGFPEESTKIELDLLSEIFSPETLDLMFFNPSNGLGNSFHEGQFQDLVEVDQSYSYLVVPKGLILVVGSSNTILPVITSIVLSYICGNVTVCQLSKLNGGVISKFIDGMPSRCSDYTHFTGLDHADPVDVGILKQALIEIPWNVINVWGGEDANNFYFRNVAENPARPRVLNMEPLTGIVIIQKSFLQNNQNKVSADLARSICEMGQQLCSSPTEGYIVDDCDRGDEADAFFTDLIDDLERRFVDFENFETSYFKLDRMLTFAQDHQSRVHLSKKYGNKISVIQSKDQSVFESLDDTQSVSIHERRNFLELIEVGSFASLLGLIRRVGQKYTHREIKKVQTILVFGDQGFNTEVLRLAKKVGAYRVVDSRYIFERHPLEALDGSHLINEFTYHLSVIGSVPYQQPG